MNIARTSYQKGKMQHKLAVGRHELVADVPVDQGGEDSGPSPHDYLAAALASCTSITLRMYAQRKGWPLESADVAVGFVKEGEITQLSREITLVGALDPTQRQRLLEIANRCPVHRILSGKIEIQTSLKD